jgi:hypothetical protein
VAPSASSRARSFTVRCERTVLIRAPATSAWSGAVGVWADLGCGRCVA